MANESSPDEIKALWQSQEVKEVRMSLQEIQKRAKSVRKLVQRRTIVGSVVVYSSIVYFVLAWFFVPYVLARIGSCLTVLALAYLAYQLHSRRGESLAPDPIGVTGIRAYRIELERQRDFHRGGWFWSRLPRQCWRHWLETDSPRRRGIRRE